MYEYLKSIERRIRKYRKRIFARTPKPNLFPDINHLLHELRGQAFSRLEFSAQHLVSVGCAGTWYFNWIQERFGDVEKHTGVEFYSPCPDDLPSNCTWIANTAGHMPEISDNTADAVFSGQNLEHLWPEEVIGFYLESNRILRRGGKLVVDSPNRIVTKQLGWSHPEHTVELTPQEAVELTELAGFDVDYVEGLWLCIDSESQEVLPFDSQDEVGEFTVQKRMSDGRNQAENSFIWWVVATKSDRPVNPEALTNRMNEIFAQAWPERCKRTKTIIGQPTEKDAWLTSKGKAGVLLFGPYFPVKKGDYTAKFTLRASDSLSSCSGAQTTVCDVVGGHEGRELGRHVVSVADMNGQNEISITIPFSVDQTTFGIQFRVITEEGVAIETCSHVVLEDLQPHRTLAA